MLLTVQAPTNLEHVKKQTKLSTSFDPSTLQVETEEGYEFKISMVYYTASSWTARATVRHLKQKRWGGLGGTVIFFKQRPDNLKMYRFKITTLKSHRNL